MDFIVLEKLGLTTSLGLAVVVLVSHGYKPQILSSNSLFDSIHYAILYTT